jgi:two-component system, chemotaxis family, sensor kinase CheA
VANDRFLSMFFEEAGDLLQAFESGLMDLEARQGDRAHLVRTFRAAHTLKGAAGMVGLGAIASSPTGSRPSSTGSGRVSWPSARRSTPRC